MAKRGDDLTTYPAVLWEVVKAAKEQKSYKVDALVGNMAVNLRHRFHYFRMAMIRQGHPDGALLTNIICSIVGSELHFHYLGAVLDPEGHKPVVVPGLVKDDQHVSAEPQSNAAAPKIDFAVANEAVRDHSEEAALAFLATERLGIEVGCAHEWDVTETRCLLCGRPK